MSELRNYMSECLCNNYNIKHYFNPITCEMIYYPYDTIYNSLCSDRCKYFGNENHCKRVCNFKHLKDIELPLNNDITECLIARHTTIDGQIGWKVSKEPNKPLEPNNPPRKLSLELYKENKTIFKNKEQVYPPSFKQLLEASTKVCCYYHNKYRPTEDMIEVYIDYKKVWICPRDDLCKTITTQFF